MSESELLEGLRAGSEPAYDSIFRTYYPQLVRIAAGMLGDQARAEEIVQDIMLELWRRRGTLHFETSLRAYLIRSTRNRALNEIRHERVARRAEPLAAQEVAPAPRADAHLLDDEIDTAVRRALNDLPERCREVFELSRVHGLKYAEIASALEISVKTVEAQMGKALKILRERLAAWLPPGGF